MTAPAEQAVLFGAGGRLAGVLSEPASDDADLPAVLLTNAGRLSRVGPNRLNVRLARRLAGLGFRTLRFDLAGLGESVPRRDRLTPVEGAVDDFRQAMDHLERVHGTARFVPIGFCSGAVFAFLAAVADERVAGAALVNPRGAADPAVVRRAAARRKLRMWRSVLHNPRLLLRPRGAGGRGVLPPDASLPASSADETAAAFRGLAARDARLLLLYSEGDVGLDLLSVALGRRLPALRREGVLEREVVRSADHSFTLLEHQEAALRALTDWVARRFGASAGGRARPADPAALVSEARA